MLKSFNTALGIKDTVEDEKKRFVNRINQTIFAYLQNHLRSKGINTIYHKLCYELGCNPQYGSLEIEFLFENIKNNVFCELSHDNFMETLKIVALLYNIFSEDQEWQQKISTAVEVVLSSTTIDIGVRWKNGVFYPSGAKELDEKLIEDPLEWLVKYPDEEKDFRKAIKSYSEKRYDDVILNCYLSIEGLARKILTNGKTLDNNREDLLKIIGLSQEWKSFLNNFINYANEFKRHASEKRHRINPLEVEALLYFTGLMVRLIIESL